MSSLEKLQAYSPTYLDYSKRWQRSLVFINGREVCGDPELDLSYRASEKHMNGLLELYFSEITNTVFAQAVETVEIDMPSPPSAIPIKHTGEVYDGRGQD